MSEEFDLEAAKNTLDEIKSDASDYDPDLEVQDIDEGLPEGLQFYQTGSTGYKTGRKPRTLRAAYDHTTSVMYVVFWDGTYYMYADVPPTVWQSFKQAESKGKFLWEEGFDSRGPRGAVYAYQPVDITKVPKRRMAALSANLEVARKLQAAYKGRRTSKTLYGKGHEYRLRGEGGFTR